MPASHERKLQVAASQEVAGFAEGTNPELRRVSPAEQRKVGKGAVESASRYYAPPIHPELRHPENHNVRLGDQN